MIKGAMTIYQVQDEKILDILRDSLLERSSEWTVCWPTDLQYPCFLAMSDNLEIQMTTLVPMVRIHADAWAYQAPRYHKLPPIDNRLVTVVHA